MELMEVIRERRSIRRFRADPVEEEKLLTVLEAARLAPSWKNGQCWRFILVTSEEGRRAVADCLPPTNPGRQALLQAPVNVVLCADPTASEEWEGRAYYLVDAAIAMEHLVLAATSLGLGTCWQGLIYEEKLRQALGIPHSVRVVAVTPLGYPDEAPKPRRRKALAEIVYRERWGEAGNF